MGNIHTVIQTKPALCKGGAVILVKRRFHDVVEKLHKEEAEKEYFYTYLEKRRIAITVSNVNILDRKFQDELLFFVIQGGGKMRFRYENLKEHINNFSKYLEDATFYIDDEYGGFVDECNIENGKFYCKRVVDEDSSAEDFLKRERPENYDDIISKLKSHANRKNKNGMARFGINSQNALGVNVSVLRKIAKGVGKNHNLALKLWDSKIHEARILATLIDDYAIVDEEQMWDWVDEFDSWDICDQCCNNLFYKTSFAWDKACQWSIENGEFVKRAGFVLMAVLAVHDKKASDGKFLKFFKYIKDGAADERNFVKKAVSWALRQIGKRNETLRKKSIGLAEKIQKADSKSAEWIGNDVLRELRKSKK